MIRLKRGEDQVAATEGRQSVFQSGGQTKQMPARPKVTPSQPKTSKKDR